MVNVNKLRVGPYDNGAYIVSCPTTSAAVVIDAAAEADRILAACAGLAVESILTTHGHHDHISAVDDVSSALDVPFLLSLADTEIAGRSPDAPISDGQEFVFGDVALHAISTPGHTPGSMCFAFEPAQPGEVHVIFTGDTLFPGGPGSTRWDYSSFGQIMDSLELRVFPGRPDETVVHPGHGEDTTLGAERPHLGTWRVRGW